MRLRLIKSVVVEGRPGLQVGDVFEVSQDSGLVASGYAVVVGGDAVETSVASQPHPIETREPEIESREPKFRRKGGK
jgi:hypothetical protein